jgi:hypothetical protein
MFWKDQLASEILAQSNITKTWLYGLTDRYPSIRVKTLDANGRVPVIQLNGKGEWLKPEEWANIHIANLKQQHVELHQRLSTVGSDPTHTGHTYGSPESAETETQSDPSLFQKLRNKYIRLSESYCKAIDELWSISQGNEMTSDLRMAVASMKSDNQYRFIRNMVRILSGRSNGMP